MRRICRLDLLPYRSEIVLAGPFLLLPRGAGRRTESRVEDGGEAVHYRARKKTIHGTFNFRSPSAASIQGESQGLGMNPVIHPPPSSFSIFEGSRMKSVIFLLDIVRRVDSRCFSTEIRLDSIG